MITVLIRNSGLGTSRFCGTFSCREFAQAYCDTEASRSRAFVSFEVYTGTPRNPGHAIPGTLRTGAK